MSALFDLPAMAPGPLRAIVEARVAELDGAALPADLVLVVLSLADRIDYANRTNTYRGFVMLTAEYRSARDQLFDSVDTGATDPFDAALAAFGATASGDTARPVTAD